jgi:hypothetical protein
VMIYSFVIWLRRQLRFARHLLRVIWLRRY